MLSSRTQPSNTRTGPAAGGRTKTGHSAAAYKETREQGARKWDFTRTQPYEGRIRQWSRKGRLRERRKEGEGSRSPAERAGPLATKRRRQKGKHRSRKESLQPATRGTGKQRREQTKGRNRSSRSFVGPARTNRLKKGNRAYSKRNVNAAQSQHAAERGERLGGRGGRTDSKLRGPGEGRVVNQEKLRWSIPGKTHHSKNWGFKGLCLHFCLGWVKAQRNARGEGGQGPVPRSIRSSQGGGKGTGVSLLASSLCRKGISLSAGVKKRRWNKVNGIQLR